MFNGEIQWMPDQKTLLVKLVPKGKGVAPHEPNERSVRASKRPTGKRTEQYL